MTFEQFEKANRKTLREEAKQCFERAQDGQSQTDFQVMKLLEAQLYMQELDRRHDSWIAWRDLILEVVVIALIGGEIWLGWKQGTNESTMMDKQDTILGNLDTSTSATAKLVQKEIDLEYDLSINVEYNGGIDIAIYNNSRSEVAFAGIKIGSMRPMTKMGAQAIIPDHNVMAISFLEYNPQLAAGISKSPPITFPLELYLRNALGDEFIWKGQLTSGNSSGNLRGNPGGRLVKERWSQTVRVLAKH